MVASPLAVRSISRAPGVAVRLARAGGVHGLYVHNALTRGQRRGFVFGADAGAGAGLCWFGSRGNLVILAGPEVDADAVAERIVEGHTPWRIAMGPQAVVEALRRRCAVAPLVHREQVYYAGEAATCPADCVAADARLADPRDRDRLVQATLQLNESDLSISPRRIDRRWLYDTIDERLAAGTTWVCGPPGRLTCKLEVASAGPLGTVVEGVFTFPAARRRGLASGLVAACITAVEGRVILHVAADNVAARSAYARAGMTEVARCWLLLLC